MALAFDDAVSYTQWGKWSAAQLNVMAVTVFLMHTPRVLEPSTLTKPIELQDSYPCPQGHILANRPLKDACNCLII